MSTVVEEKPSAINPALGDSWKIIVLNDNHNSFTHVASSLADNLPGYDYNKGMSKAVEIDRKGMAIVWSGMREPAELYWQILESTGLTLAPLEC